MSDGQHQHDPHHGRGGQRHAGLQPGRTCTTQENAGIVAFLQTLTGDQPSCVLPILPPSGDATPRPTPFN